MSNPLAYSAERVWVCQKGFITLGAGPKLKMFGGLATLADKGTMLN